MPIISSIPKEAFITADSDDRATMLFNSQLILKHFMEGKSLADFLIIRFCYIHLLLYLDVLEEARQTQAEHGSMWIRADLSEKRAEGGMTKPRKPLWDDLWISMAFALQLQWDSTRINIPSYEGEYWHGDAESGPLSRQAYESEVSSVAKGCLQRIFQMDRKIDEKSSNLLPDALVARIMLFIPSQPQFKSPRMSERLPRLTDRLNSSDTSLPRPVAYPGIEDDKIFGLESDTAPASPGIDSKPITIANFNEGRQEGATQQTVLQRTSSQLAPFKRSEVTPITPGSETLRTEDDNRGRSTVIARSSSLSRRSFDLNDKCEDKFHIVGLY
ncbi:hypothetical protein PHLGIDRAFT_123594 [Phlebiopsis gigantea 11061_1 CR5-6]|uniref:Uncharacterized protein n=1 Tax=Phlebiopsis gigantea (strain 11061_1 CR5-6) TaxID=745531 RepID=A0A0C3P918_PHLG1|nr:hypothetical protein PHLGIDRAFT_123594 [Phlebiopsis gigantea 11061_1 CR5-6]